MKLSKKLMILSLFLVIVCCIGSASAADTSVDSINTTIDDYAVDEVMECVDDNVESGSSISDEVLAKESDDINNIEKEIKEDDSNNILGSSYNVDPDECEEYYIFYVEDGDILYLKDGTYNIPFFSNEGYSITFIGEGDNAVFPSLNSKVNSYNDITPVLTFVNVKINNVGITMNSKFINCTFTNSNIDLAKEIENFDPNTYGFTFNYIFENCKFKDVNTQSSVINLYKYGKIVLNNCTFENISADSIIGKNGDFNNQDRIYLYDCNFSNCNVNGIVDIPGTIKIADYCAIENCNYDFEATTTINSVDGNAHNYLNATKLNLIGVDSVIDISSSEKGVVVITLTDGTAPVVGATVKYTINGGTELSNLTDSNGQIKITGLKGLVDILANFTGNDAYNANSTSKSFDFRDNTNIVISNESKVIIITLTDGTAPVVGATVKYTINGGTELSNLTDSNGQIKITGLKGLVDILANFTGNDAYNANSTSKSFDFRDNTNIVISNESKVIIITLTDGTAPVVGATVKYTINGGAELSNLTDGNGQIKITAVPDEFEINATYLGDNLYKQSSNSQKFNFTKPPVNNNTDDKNNSNVKPADNNKKTDQQKTKKPVATKITAKKATFKAKKKAKKYTIILKAGKKAVAKVKVTLKVGKKTYKATTNKKGKAIFNLKKLTKKGKYTAVIKFKGNKNYKATSKKVKIIVK